MKLKLRVLDPKQKKLPITENDGRWNCEKEFEIPERLILQLIDEITDELVEDQFYSLDAAKHLRRRKLMNTEIEKVVKSARAWKKIHILISDQGFQTSRFTRISLFEELMNEKKMKDIVKEKVMEMEQEKSAPKIPEEKSPKEIEPHTTAPRIHQSLFTEFVNKVN